MPHDLIPAAEAHQLRQAGYTWAEVAKVLATRHGGRKYSPEAICSAVRRWKAEAQENACQNP